MEYWVWLASLKLPPEEVKKILEIYKTPRNIWDIKKIKNTTLKQETIIKLANKQYKNNLDMYIKYMQKNNIGIVTMDSKKYPEKLKVIDTPPYILFTLGDINILSRKSIAIVGSRNCTNYGIKVSQEMAYKLSENNIDVISGLAKGIDTNAHMGAIAAKGKTIAVLGTGIDIIYPKENKELFYKILEKGGLIVSEYFFAEKPAKENFPKRNRIISGLSDGILVIEAREKSGALITVDYALQQGKEVYVVPGDIKNEASIGSNNLIKQGAKLATNIIDIIEDFS